MERKSTKMIINFLIEKFRIFGVEKKTDDIQMNFQEASKNLVATGFGSQVAKVREKKQDIS